MCWSAGMKELILALIALSLCSVEDQNIKQGQLIPNYRLSPLFSRSNDCHNDIFISEITPINMNGRGKN